MPYTTLERRQLREAFVPRLARYHRLARWTNWLGLASVACVVAITIGNMAEFDWPVPPLLFGVPLFVAALVVGLRTNSLLKCPGCTQPLETLGLYCPECGQAGLVPAVRKWFGGTSAHCNACGRDLVVQSGGRGGPVRKYTIRACSSCGLWLDEKGF